MLVKSILNQIEKIPGFVITKCRWSEHRDAIEVIIRPRKGGKATCSQCHRPAPLYDRLSERRFAYVPMLNIPVTLLYTMRRVACGECGVHAEEIPWADGKQRSARSYVWFLAMWARRMSWAEVAEAFGASWQTVSRAVEHAVEWGRARMPLDGITAIGVDEILHRRGSKAHGGPKYLTVVYQINDGVRRLLWVGVDRTQTTLNEFFDWLGDERAAKLEFVCSDMWPAYLKVLRERAIHAVQILDRFHVVAILHKAVDRVRAAEARELQRRGSTVLTNTRWLFLKRRENLSETQHEKLRDILRLNLKIVRAYLVKQSFDRFWRYHSRTWARKFLASWCDKVMRSKIEPMKRAAKTIRQHAELLLNWLDADDVALGAVEGFNNKAKVTLRKSYGFRSVHLAKVALYHALGDLPEPEFTHRFW